MVVRFVQELSMTPTSLKEISARVVKTCAIPFGPGDLPRTVIDYLLSANCCVNPECKGEIEKLLWNLLAEVLSGGWKSIFPRENCSTGSAHRILKYKYRRAETINVKGLKRVLIGQYQFICVLNHYTAFQPPSTLKLFQSWFLSSYWHVLKKQNTPKRHLGLQVWDKEFFIRKAHLSSLW